jgi:hypothetical protein
MPYDRENPPHSWYAGFYRIDEDDLEQYAEAYKLYPGKEPNQLFTIPTLSGRVPVLRATLPHKIETECRSALDYFGPLGLLAYSPNQLDFSPATSARVSEVRVYGVSEERIVYLVSRYKAKERPAAYRPVPTPPVREPEPARCVCSHNSIPSYLFENY